MEEKDNKHSITNNSAIGSWAGYIYQGLCAIYVVVRMIKEEQADEYKNYTFYIDSFEDFSIHDETGMAVSLHQCKDKKSGGNYQKDLDLMRRQKKELIDIGKCNDGTKMFFHCNTKPSDMGNDIKMYKYLDGDETCQSEELINKLEDLVSTIIKKHGTNKSAKSAFNALLRRIDQQVMKIHEMSFNSKLPLYELARDPESALSFSDICDILFSDAASDYKDEEFLEQVKFYLLIHIKETVEDLDETEDWDNVEREYAIFIEDLIGKMDSETFERFIRRTHPDIKFCKDIKSFVNSTNKIKAGRLVTLVGSAQSCINSNCEWHQKEQIEIPTVFDLDKKKSVCNSIYSNRSNLNSLYEYDWFVTNQFHTVKNFNDVLMDINKIKEELENNIFKPKTKGILNIKDMNNGNFE